VQREKVGTVHIVSSRPAQQHALREAIRRVAFEALASGPFGGDAREVRAGSATVLPSTVAGALYVPSFRTDTLPDAINRALQLVSAAATGRRGDGALKHRRGGRLLRSFAG